MKWRVKFRNLTADLIMEAHHVLTEPGWIKLVSKRVENGYTDYVIVASFPSDVVFSVCEEEA
jgi:hypothetical protein